MTVDLWLTKIEIDVPDCPKVVPNVMGIPSWVVGWSIAAVVALALGLVISAAVVRYHAHEEETSRRQHDNTTRIKLAEYRKVCPTCGDKYEPDRSLADGEKIAGTY